jgi:hypothetical protein
VALANVGLFFALDKPPVVPDVLLSLGVKAPTDVWEKRHRSYFIWEFGKSPDVVVEIVSNTEGGELGAKMDRYAQIGIPIYVVWDPAGFLSSTPLQAFVLHIRAYEPLSPDWFEAIGLGLKIWHGTFEQIEGDWLRWCDSEGQVIPLGQERADQAEQRGEQERTRADQAEERAARLEAQLRQLGVEPAGDNQ